MLTIPASDRSTGGRSRLESVSQAVITASSPAKEHKDLAALARRAALPGCRLLVGGARLADRRPHRIPARPRRIRLVGDRPHDHDEVERVSAAPTPPPAAPSLVVARTRSRFLDSSYAGSSRAVLGHGVLAARTSNYWIIRSGFFQPVFYLVSLG